ncbi:MAG: filamentous hemagglutinin N-terminal domain-containing protein [Alphaproteobacteria bacterium]|nr:filamentous hemagglutinin N-terminal domain-containing protein [Alphaproteobacteria bacterium]
MDLKARNLFLATSALVSLGVTAAFANPLGNQVVGGSAVVQGQGTSSVTVTQTTDRAIINWNTFNINAGETTRFIQPSASSVVLNRVTGGLGPSTIDGSLYANGRVFLVNPNGLLIGSTGVIDTAGFLATTADIKNSDFMAGRYQFYTPGNAGASIVNLGTITAQNSGFAALVAPGVRNSGTITATLGTVGLTAGNAFTLDFYGDKLITVQVGDSIATQVRDVATGRPLDSLVKNDGKISANGGRVELTAAAVRTIVDSVINTSGTIEANTVASKNGTIILGAATRGTKMAGDPTQTVKVSGKISAQGRRRGQTGGTVQITGEDIQLTNAKVSVAGRAGGGTALIGGDIGGGKGNPYATAALQQSAVPTASTVSIDSSSTIDASAWGSGNGGKVVVWADKATSFYGDIQARAGIRSGNGGFVEVPGKEQLAFHGTVDTSADNGKRGTLLLDPQDITIGGGGVFDIAIATLQAALAANDVAIVTGAGAGNGDITVVSSFSWGGSNSLLLGAFRNVAINNGVTITNTGTGELNIAAGVETSGSVWTPTGVGTINLLGTIDFSNSLGKVNFAYNPASGAYATPNAFNNVLVNRDFQTEPGSRFTTQFSPYMWVNNVTDLQNIRDNLAGFYVLATIDASGSSSLNGGAGFAPIGNASNQFTGRLVGLDDKVFGGRGGQIDNLTINYSGPNGTLGSPALVGLFGSIGTSGVISDIALNASITSTAPFSHVGGFAGTNAGAILHSTFSGSIDVTGSPSVVGGMAGNNSGLLDNTSSSASLQNVGSTNINEAAIGGLVGLNTGDIRHSFTTGATTMAGSGNNGAIGGLVGDNSGNILFSYATGPVTVSAAATTDAGGLVGVNKGSLNQTYATGLITSPASGTGINIGGLVGRVDSGGTAITSYFDIATTGTSASQGGHAIQHKLPAVESERASITVAFLL